MQYNERTREYIGDGIVRVPFLFPRLIAKLHFLSIELKHTLGMQYLEVPYVFLKLITKSSIPRELKHTLGIEYLEDVIFIIKIES